MKFQTHNDANFWVGGCLQGEIVAEYADLKKLLGQPTDGDGYKVDAEWDIEFEDGTMATIYNWKDGKNYNGKSGTPKTQIRDWHVGGDSQRSVELVEELLKGLHTREPFKSANGFSIEIKGEGDKIAVGYKLKAIAEKILRGDHEADLKANGEVEWEDDVLFTSIKE